MWITEGKKNTPSAGVVLADTGALESGGNLNVVVVITATVAATATIRHYDTDGTTVLKSHFIKCAANDTIAIPFGYVLTATDERLKIVLEAASLGDVQASLVY